jgi:hydrogenase nickel incorporation protein HypA/HybF
MRMRRKGFAHREGLRPLVSFYKSSAIRHTLYLGCGVESTFRQGSVHELSIVSSIVDSVITTLEAYPGASVKEVRLRIGALASVVEDSLQFCYGIATDDTPLQGSKLVVRILPVVMHCESCAQDVEIESLQSFRCPRCGELVADLRQGRELEIESIEIDEVEEKV